jgi:hypothetical protein
LVVYGINTLSEVISKQQSANFRDTILNPENATDKLVSFALGKDKLKD